MAKKQVDEDDDFDDFENTDDDKDDYQIDNSDDESDDFSDDANDLLLDDDVDIDIVIEINEDDLDLNGEEVVEETSSGEEIILSKHKIEGKHSLKYDSIFKGKKEEPLSEDDVDGFSTYFKETIEVDKSSIYHHESIDNELYVRAKQVKERVYDVLKSNTSLNFLNNRRKPSKVDFNDYYELLKLNLKDESFTNIELFNELAVY